MGRRVLRELAVGAACALSAFIAPSAIAQERELITFTFSGQVTSPIDWALEPEFVRYADFETGDPFSISYTWSNPTPLLLSVGTTYAFNPIVSTTFNIDGLTFVGGSGGSVTILDSTVLGDRYSVVAPLSGPALGPLMPQSYRIDAIGLSTDFVLSPAPDGTFFTLPTAHPSNGGSMQLTFVDELGHSFSLAGQGMWTSAVSPIPEPETYAMLLAGLALLGFATRRKSRTTAAA